MKPSQVASVLKTCIEANEPVMIMGAPGIGKTEIVAQVANDIDHALLVDRLSQKDPTDFTGLPKVTDESTSWKTPDYFPRKGCADTLWFFDEWAQGAVAVQNAAGQLLDGRLGSYVVPKNVRMVAASNRRKDRAGTNPVPTHIADRFFIVEAEADLNDWTKWALANGVALEIIAFLQFRPSLLSDFDPTRDCSPSPRGWTKLSRVMAKNPCKDVLHDLIAGKIGAGAAIEFYGFLPMFKSIQNVNAIIMNPDTADVPDANTKGYLGILSALATVLASKASDSNFGQICRYAARMGGEHNVCTIRQAILRDPSLQTTRAFIEWTAANQPQSRKPPWPT